MKLGENGIGSSGPNERPLVQIVISHIGIDLVHQFTDTAKRAAPDCLLGDQSEPTLYLVEPAAIGRGVMNVVTRLPCEPSLDLGMFMGAVVVGDQVDIESRRNAVIEVTEKREKFLMTMARFAHSDDLAIEHVEGRE